jgi:hypothetical protein
MRWGRERPRSRMGQAYVSVKNLSTGVETYINQYGVTSTRAGDISRLGYQGMYASDGTNSITLSHDRMTHVLGGTGGFASNVSANRIEYPVDSLTWTTSGDVVVSSPFNIDAGGLLTWFDNTILSATLRFSNAAGTLRYSFPLVVQTQRDVVDGLLRVNVYYYGTVSPQGAGYTGRHIIFEYM